MILPTPPPDFNIQFYRNEGIQLNPVEVYLNAIDAMYEIAHHFRWNEMWPRPSSIFELADRGVRIIVTREGQELRTLHVALGLYFTVITMIASSPFYQYGADMYRRDRLIGRLSIEQIPTTTPLSTSIEAIDYINTSNTTTRNSTSHSSGLGRTIIWHNMNIYYEFAGARINSKDLYTAVLSGLADAAKAGMDTVCTELQAYSQADNLVFWVDGHESASHPFTYKEVTDLFRAVVAEMTLEQRRFGEINFIVTDGNDGLASGFIHKLALQGNVTAGVVVAR